jgi:hypothetical protein
MAYLEFVDIAAVEEKAPEPKETKGTAKKKK